MRRKEYIKTMTEYYVSSMKITKHTAKRAARKRWRLFTKHKKKGLDDYY